MIVTRFAPNSKGGLHIGNFKIIVILWYIVYRYKGLFIIRVDNINKENFYNQDRILKILRIMKINFSLLINQNLRKSIYIKFAIKLLDNNKVYYKNNIMFFKYRKNYIGRFYDIRKGFIYNKNYLYDFAILNKYNKPTYNFSSAIDDYLFGVNFIARGSEHLENTFKQLSIFRAICNRKLPVFFHISILLNKKKEKISKRKDNRYKIFFLLKKGIFRRTLFFNIINISFNIKRDIFLYPFFKKGISIKDINSPIKIYNFNDIFILNKIFIRKMKLKYLFKTTGIIFLFLKYFINRVVILSQLKELSVYYLNKFNIFIKRNYFFFIFINYNLRINIINKLINISNIKFNHNYNLYRIMYNECNIFKVTNPPINIIIKSNLLKIITLNKLSF